MPKNIYIGLIGGVGDLVLASPSIAALKKKYPNAKNVPSIPTHMGRTACNKKPH